ncbi:MAG: acVLRF1 family peptidyl-tRNA hydrolase [Angustibacter sp.]
MSPERLGGWVTEFIDRHGSASVSVTLPADPHATDTYANHTDAADTSPAESSTSNTSSPAAVRFAAADGARADVEVPWPPLPVPLITSGSPGRDGPIAVAAAVAEHAALARTVGLVLVRRGGWAVGLARDGRLLTHVVGRRYVQARTAAGGWSQQRYARRRAGQADALVGTVADAAAQRLVGADLGNLDGVVVGGDQALVRAVLSDSRLAAVSRLPRGPSLPVPDPRLVVLTQAAVRIRAVRVRLTEP